MNNKKNQLHGAWPEWRWRRRRLRKEWEQYIGETARDKETESNN